MWDVWSSDCEGLGRGNREGSTAGMEYPRGTNPCPLEAPGSRRMRCPGSCSFLCSQVTLTIT